MAEDDHRQAGVLGPNEAVNGGDIGDDLAPAGGRAESAWWRIGGRREAMAAMVVRIAVEAALCQKIGKALVARRMLG